MPPNAFKTAPLVVLNNFAPQQKQLALAASLFQGMFPSINVHNVNLATCQVGAGFGLRHVVLPRCEVALALGMLYCLGVKWLWP
jgi:hypothetical protein